jgi:YkoY family integral membrane protein
VPTTAAILETLPVIVSLIVIEGLLSVDNALAIAALASHLPEKQQQLALKLGIIGAYVFRGIALLCVSLIIENPWLKILGSAYLVWLMASNIVSKEEAPDVAKAHHHRPGLVATIFQIEIMDLTLSLDNVVAAVALDKRLWVICTGVFYRNPRAAVFGGHVHWVDQKISHSRKNGFFADRIRGLHSPHRDGT